MNFVPHFVSSPLDSYIQSVFHFSGLKPDHSIERVVPTGHIFLIFELDGFPRNTFDNETLKSNRTFSKVWVSGMHRNYLSISAHQDSEMFVVQFKPQGSYPFFHFPIHELDEKVVAAEEVFGEEVLALREAIFQGKNSAEKFELAEQWLNDRFDATKTPPKDLEAFLSRLQTEPAGKFTEIVTDYSKTQKHLIDQFKKYIGLTPKYLHRI
ncbi:MAG TPA: AraC family transcriptional regulator, partial [Bacteroidetes bacterium]|nr:AraC family transcriptional regulator [Bacteroidota bacterium]